MKENRKKRGIFDGEVDEEAEQQYLDQLKKKNENKYKEEV